MFIKLTTADYCVQPLQAVDGMLEAEKDGKAIGTTKRGIGPCYSSKVTGIAEDTLPYYPLLYLLFFLSFFLFFLP